mgnify:CR=1 FL=1
MDISFSEADRLLKEAREQLDREEVEYLHQHYPEGLRVGSLLWLKWRHKY